MKPLKKLKYNKILEKQGIFFVVKKEIYIFRENLTISILLKFVSNFNTKLQWEYLILLKAN